MTTSTPIHTSSARTVEAAKMLMDWSKWLVTVQIAMIGALGFIGKPADLKVLLTMTSGVVAVTLGVLAIFSFVISILYATYLLLFLPTVVEGFPEGADAIPGQIFLLHVRIPFAPGWQVGTFTANQTRFFMLGIVLFLGAYATLCFTLL